MNADDVPVKMFTGLNITKTGTAEDDIINIYKALLLVILQMQIAQANPLLPVIHHAATLNDVPPDILSKICTHESQAFNQGNRIAWPWTINFEGKGYWFKNKSAALMFAENLIRQQKLNFDIGLCQINWYWHKDDVKSLSSILDPTNNADYAAKYLKSVKKNGSWMDATGKYHSLNNTEKARQYAEKVFN